jgi:hypothetical protein
MSHDLKIFHKTNVFIWATIIAAMIVLSLVVFILDQQKSFVPIPEAVGVSKILFIVAVVLAFGILILKRTAFLPQKIVSRTVKKAAEDKTRIILNIIRRNYIVVWAVAELICLIGFITYIFTVNFQSYLIFAVVGIYSVLINFPRQYLAEGCIERLAEYSEQEHF